MPVVAAAAIGAGASIYSASQAKSAASNSLAAQQAAQAQARQDAQAAQQTVTDLQNPYYQGGTAAYNQLLSRSGVPTGTNSYGGPANGAANAPATYNNYLSTNPDLAAEAQRVTSDGEFPSVQAYLQWHDANYGNEGRPSTPDQTQAQATDQTGTAAPDPFAPQAWNAPTDFGQAPQLPGLSAIPGAPDLSSEAFQRSPLYNLGLAEGQRNLNSNFGARGLLRSGAAIKGALDFARQNVNNNYSTFANTQIAANQQNQYAAAQGNTQALNLYSQAANQYNNNRNFDYGQYTDSLNYNNNRYDTANNNLFRLAGAGQNAANTIGNAATNVANVNGNLALAGGQSQSDYANQVAAANSQLGGSLAGIGQNLFNNLGRTSSLTPVSTVDPYGYGSNALTAVSPYNPGVLTQPKMPVF